MFVPATATAPAPATSSQYPPKPAGVPANAPDNPDQPFPGYPAGWAHPSSTMTAANPVVAGTQDTTKADASRLYQQIYNDASAKLTPIMGVDAARARAVQLAGAAQANYVAVRTAGGSPQAAIANSTAGAQSGIADEFKQIGQASPYEQATGATGGGAVNDADRAKALDQYRTGIDKGQSVYQGIVDNPVNDPNARDTFNPVTGQRTTTTLVDDPHQIKASTVAAPDKPTVATATAAGAIKTADATAAPAINPALLTPAQRLQAATQTATQVQGTGLDTGQADESRTAATQALQALQATSRGQGAAQVRSDAQLKVDLAKAAAVAAGAARGARGSERKGALIQSAISSGEQGAQAVAANAAKTADVALAAEQAVGTQAQGNRAQDIAQAAKRADLESQQRTLQAQLDAARAAGDAGREQDIRTKMADLDQQMQALNAQAKNTAEEAAAGRTTTVSLANAGAKNTAGEGGANRMADASKTNAGFYNTAGENDAARRLAAATTTAGLQTDVAKTNVANQTIVDTQNADRTQRTDVANADRGLQAGIANNAGGLAAVVAGSGQDVAQADLRMRAQQAIEASAQGLLSESERQNQLAIARQQLQIAQQRGDREGEQSWFDKISALVTTVGTVAKVVAPVAVAASDERLKTNIKKVDKKDLRELAKAVQDSLSTYEHRTDLAADLPPGLHLGAMAQALMKTKLGPATVSTRPDGFLQVDYAKIAAALAAHDVDTKKRRAA
jgi:hypothetical protein